MEKGDFQDTKIGSSQELDLKFSSLDKNEFG